MSNLRSLPAELQLFVLQESSLSNSDLVRCCSVSARWRVYINTNRTTQERLFLRHLQAPSTTIFPRYNIVISNEVVIRPVPITAPHEYTEGTHEMTWKLIEARPTDPGGLKYVNPIWLDLGH
jgi:hypothetical protein